MVRAAAALEPCTSQAGAPVVTDPAQTIRGTAAWPRTPSVGLLVPLIRPLEYERRFWSSAFYHTASKDIDALHLFSRTSADALFVFRFYKGIPAHISDPYCRLSNNLLALDILHIALKALAPEMYKDIRWVLVIHFRVFSCMTMLQVCRYLRGTLSQCLHLGYVDSECAYQLVRGNPHFTTARAIFICSLSVLSCLHSLPPIMPFALAAAIQVIYLAATFTFFAAPAADLFSDPMYATGTQQLCNVIAAALPTLPAPAGTAPICGPHRAWLLVLFCALFVGFALPLYIIHAFERRLKLRFLRELCEAHASPPPAPPATAAARFLRRTLSAAAGRIVALAGCTLLRPKGRHGAPSGVPMTARWLAAGAFHACTLALLAAACWQVVVATHVPLARYAMSLHCPGASYQWHRELVCSAGGPCSAS